MTAAQDDPAAQPAASSPTVVSLSCHSVLSEVVAGAEPAMRPEGQGNLQGESAAAPPAVDEAAAAADQQQPGKQARLAEVEAAAELQGGERVAQGGSGSVAAGLASDLPAPEASGSLLGLAAAQEPQGTPAEPDGVRLELAGPGAPAASRTAGERQQSPAASVDCLDGSRSDSPPQVFCNAMEDCSGSRPRQDVAALPPGGQATSSKTQLGRQRSRLTMSDEVMAYPAPAAGRSGPLGRAVYDVRAMELLVASSLGGPGSSVAGHRQAVKAGPGSLPGLMAAPVLQGAQVWQRSNSPGTDSDVCIVPASAEERLPSAVAASYGSLPKSTGSQHQQQPSDVGRSADPAAAAVAAAVAVAAAGGLSVQRRRLPAKADDCHPKEGHARRAEAAAAAGRPPVQHGGRPAQAAAACPAAACQGGPGQRLTEIAAAWQRQQGVDGSGHEPNIRALQHQLGCGGPGNRTRVRLQLAVAALPQHQVSSGLPGQQVINNPRQQHGTGGRLHQPTLRPSAVGQAGSSPQRPAASVLRPMFATPPPLRPTAAGPRPWSATAAPATQGTAISPPRVPPAALAPQQQRSISYAPERHHITASTYPVVPKTMPDVEQVELLAKVWQAGLQYRGAVEALLNKAVELQKLPGVQQFLHRVQDDVQVGACLAAIHVHAAAAGTTAEPAEASSMHMDGCKRA